MKTSQLRLLVSCHGWEDFPTHLTGEQAENLLVNWCALWHPVLVALTRSVPSWHRVDSLPEDSSEFLFVCPTVSEPRLPVGFAQRVADQKGHLIFGSGSRESIAQECIAKLDLTDNSPPEIGELFFALGFTFLQIQILCRQYRYSGSLDEVHFQRVLTSAAQAAVDNQHADVHKHITTCFDLLMEERNRYFANDIVFVDWTLACGEQIKRLTRQADFAKQNVLLNQASLECMRGNVQLLDEFKRKVDEKLICVLGGEYCEAETELLSLNSLIESLQIGGQKFEECLGQPVRVYARQRFGMSPVYPHILRQLGYLGVIHPTLDDGRFPTNADGAANWAGFSDQSIPALVDTPHDATLADTFLKLAGTISQLIDRRHQAVISFVHWAGDFSPFYRDLVVAAKFGNALGNFANLEEFFADDFSSYATSRWLPDEYQSPYFRQTIDKGASDPVSRWMRYWKGVLQRRAAAAIDAMTSVLGQQPSVESINNSCAKQSAEVASCGLTDDTTNFGDLAKQELEFGLAKFAQQICVKPCEGGGSILVNPHSVPRRQFFETEAGGLQCHQKGAIYFQEKHGDKVSAVVDVPALGFVFLEHVAQVPPPAKALALVQGNVLRNEFFQVTIDEKSGGIRSLMLYNERGNLFSQQLALRHAGERRNRTGNSGVYSKMVCDDYQLIKETRAQAIARTEGRLILSDKPVAKFIQTVTITRGIRVFDVHVTLQPDVTIRPNAWEEYFAWRSAWSAEASRIFGGINEQHTNIGRNRFASPLYIDIDSGVHRTTLFTGGVPYHQRDGYRMLDSILIAANETTTDFHFGVGVDVANCLHEAIGKMIPSIATTASTMPDNPAGYAYHFNRRNVLPIHWNCQARDGGKYETEIWLQETEGKDCQLKLTCPFRPQRSVLVDLQGEQTDVCEIKADQVFVSLRKNSLARLVLDWKST